MILTPSKAPDGPALIALSARECDVLRLLIHGKSPSDIAWELHLTENTSRRYIRLLCQGAGVKNMRQLIVWGIQNPGAAAGRPARAGLHPADCECGSPTCAHPASTPLAA